MHSAIANPPRASDQLLVVELRDGGIDAQVAATITSSVTLYELHIAAVVGGKN